MIFIDSSIHLSMRGLYMKLYYSIKQKLIELIYSNIPRSGTILLFHEVDNDISNCIEYPRNWISRDSFTTLIEYIQKNAEIKPIGSVLTNMQRNNIIITFDDVYRNFYYNAYPLLKKYSIPFCLFVTVDRIDKEYYLTSEMIEDLTKEPLCTIGSHSITHKKLRFLKLVSIIDEINNSKAILEKKISKPVKYFAFPYGSYYAVSFKNIGCVKKAGYTAAFSTIYSDLNIFSKLNRYFLPRRNVNEDNYKEILEGLIL
ncbi:polysaccharide deacetylase family protein [Tissierella creatinini]|nr:polysaccharide deacetylase family protein [Tissierella creatinini]TJX61065.1 polysaccharide deacetylase family protein [Soehngenia saccharolytica]